MGEGSFSTIPPPGVRKEVRRKKERNLLEKGEGKKDSICKNGKKGRSSKLNWRSLFQRRQRRFAERENKNLSGKGKAIERLGAKEKKKALCVSYARWER